MHRRSEFPLHATDRYMVCVMDGDEAIRFIGPYKSIQDTKPIIRKLKRMNWGAEVEVLESPTYALSQMSF